MKHIVKVLFICFSIGFLLVSCEMIPAEETPPTPSPTATPLSTPEPDIEITGDWLDSLGGTLSVDGATMTSGYGDTVTWVADITTYNNDSWNAGEAGAGDCGYAVIRYTQASIYAPQSQDKYMVLRWQNFTESEGEMTVSYSEGYGDYFDDEESARAGATNAAGYFTFFTDGAVRQ
ncbi:MAG: hypothetical protein JXB03_05890 [Spirochaetales bacterium]|nr:hypothetical protein [Spirochaetales bacterium]